MQPDLTRIIELATQVATSLGLTLVEVKLTQQGRMRTLAVTIFKCGERISLDDCEQMSRKLDALLEEQSPPALEGAFSLEVQSPGIDRKLDSEREFSLFSGQPVEVKTKEKVDGLGSAFTGKLAGLADGRVLIEQPVKISDRPQHKKQKVTEPAKTPPSIAVELSNVIHVRLIPQATTTE